MHLHADLYGRCGGRARKERDAPDPVRAGQHAGARGQGARAGLGVRADRDVRQTRDARPRAGREYAAGERAGRQEMREDHGASPLRADAFGSPARFGRPAFGGHVSGSMGRAKARMARCRSRPGGGVHGARCRSRRGRGSG